MRPRVCFALVVFVLASAALFQDALAYTFGPQGVAVVPATAKVQTTETGLNCPESQIAFNVDNAKGEWNSNEPPDFNFTYTVERDALSNRRIYVTSALVWDDRSMANDWTASGKWYVPGVGTYYAYNTSMALIESGAGSETGTVDLGKITGTFWTTRSALVRGLNHTGVFRMVAMVALTQGDGIGEAELWHSDSDVYDSDMLLTSCEAAAVNQRVGFLRSSANVTSFRTSNSTYSGEERKFMRGETVYFEFNLSANASVPAPKIGPPPWIPQATNMTLLVFNTTKQVFNSTFAVNSDNKTFRVGWAMPANAALQDYNVTLNITTKSALLGGEPWTNFTSTSVGFINKTSSEIPTQTGLDPAGTSTRPAAFWVNDTLRIIPDAGMPRVVGTSSQYFNRGDSGEWAVTILDAWGRPFASKSTSVLRINVKNTTQDAFAGFCLSVSAATDAAGRSTLNAFTIANGCTDTYDSTTPGISEHKGHFLTVIYGGIDEVASYGNNTSQSAMIDIDANHYLSKDNTTFSHIMRGDTNRFNVSIKNVRNNDTRDGTSVIMRLYDPSGTEVYETNMTTVNGVTTNWDRAFANSDAVGTWTAKYQIQGTNLTFNFNNSMVETAGSTFTLNNTIIVNSTSNIENNLYGQIGTSPKAYNRNESVNVTGKIYHSDGGVYRVKKPTGDTARTITLQLFKDSYGVGSTENSSVSVSSTTGLFYASINISSAAEDTYASSSPGAVEATEYDVRFYDGGTISSNNNGNDGNSTNQFDADSQYYYNSDTVTFSHVMRGDTNRVAPVIRNVRDVAVRDATSVTARLYNPSNSVVYQTNITTSSGTATWDQQFANSDGVGTWTAKYLIDGRNNITRNFNNTLSEATGSTFTLNNTIIVNSTSNVENNLYGETSTFYKTYNKNETINVTAKLFHSDGGVYRVKTPSSTSARTITLQLFNLTYGNGAFENTSVSVSSTTGLLYASIKVPVDKTANDTYLSSGPNATETREYDIRFYEGGTTASAANGNDGNTTNQLDVDDHYYLNKTVIQDIQFNRGDSDVEANYRFVGARGNFITSGTGNLSLRDSATTVRDTSILGFTNGWINHTSYTFTSTDRVGLWSARAINSTGSGGNEFDLTTTDAFNLTDTLNVTNLTLTLSYVNLGEVFNATGVLLNPFDGELYASKTSVTSRFEADLTNEQFSNTTSTNSSAGFNVMHVVSQAALDTYKDIFPDIAEEKNYSINVTHSGNSGDVLNVLDVDNDYYRNLTLISSYYFNRGGPKPQYSMRVVNVRNAFVNSGSGNITFRNPSSTPRSTSIVSFSNGWLNKSDYAFTTDDQLGIWTIQVQNSTSVSNNTFDVTNSTGDFELTDQLTVQITNRVENYKTNPPDTTNTTSNFDVRVLYANGTAVTSRTFPSWWNRSFEFRKNVTIDNRLSTVARTDYPVSIAVDTQSLTTAGKLNATGADLRFIDSDGTTELSYWNETPFNAATTRLWIKIPSIPASTRKNVTMYYGYPSAEAKSSSTGMFTYFNDYTTNPTISTTGCTLPAAQPNSFIRWNSGAKFVEFQFEEDECTTGTFTGTHSITSNAQKAIRFKYNGTAQNGIDGLIPVTFGVKNANSDKLLGKATADDPGTDTIKTYGRLEDPTAITGSGNDETTAFDRNSPFTGFFDAGFNNTHVTFKLYDSSGGLLTERYVATGVTPVIESNWDTLEIQRIAADSVTPTNNRHHGSMDNFIVRPFTAPDPGFSLLSEELENATRNFTLTLQNRTPIAPQTSPSAIKHDHVFVSTNATGYFAENDYTFADANDNGTWRVNVTAILDNNTGNATLPFNVSVPSTGGGGVTFTINVLDTFNEDIERQGAFEEEEKVVIRANATHTDGRALIDRIFVNITAANNTKIIDFVQMTNKSQITVGTTEGYTYEYNYTVAVGDAEGEWTIDAFANSTDGRTATKQQKFDVVVFRNIDVTTPGSQPYTLRIGSHGRARKGDVPLSGG